MRAVSYAKIWIIPLFQHKGAFLINRLLNLPIAITHYGRLDRRWPDALGAAGEIEGGGKDADQHDDEQQELGATENKQGLGRGGLSGLDREGFTDSTVPLPVTQPNPKPLPERNRRRALP